MDERISDLRRLIGEVEPVRQSTLATRWNISAEAVRQQFKREGAPEPVFDDGFCVLYALSEAEAHRSAILRAAGGRGGKRGA